MGGREPEGGQVLSSPTSQESPDEEINDLYGRMCTQRSPGQVSDGALPTKLDPPLTPFIK